MYGLLGQVDSNDHESHNLLPTIVEVSHSSPSLLGIPLPDCTESFFWSGGLGKTRRHHARFPTWAGL